MCNIHTHIDTHMFLHINYKWMVYILNTNYNYITHTHILVPLGDRCKSEKSQSQRERGQAPLHTHGWSSCLHCFSGWALCCSPVIWPGAPHPWADGRKVAASPLPPPPGCEGQLLPFSSTEEVSRHMKPSLPKIPPLSYGSVTGLPQPPLQEVCLTCLSPPLPPSLSLLFPPPLPCWSLLHLGSLQGLSHTRFLLWTSLQALSPPFATSNSPRADLRSALFTINWMRIPLELLEGGCSASLSLCLKKFCFYRVKKYVFG